MERCQAMAERSGLIGTMLETGKMTRDMALEQYLFNLGTFVLDDGRTYVGASLAGCLQRRHGPCMNINKSTHLLFGRSLIKRLANVVALQMSQRLS